MAYESLVEGVPGWWLCVRYETSPDGRTTPKRFAKSIAAEEVEGAKDWTNDPYEVLEWLKEGKLPAERKMKNGFSEQ